MKLTAKQRKFVAEYVKCGNATQAAIKAGYSKKTARQAGTENLAKPVVKKAIKEEMQKFEDSKIAKAKEVIEFYTRVMRGEELEEIAIATPAGSEVVEVPPNIKTRISAGKEIMKRYPADDPMTAQQIRKLKVDADRAEAEYNEFYGENTSSSGNKLIDDWGDEELDDTEN